MLERALEEHSLEVRRRLFAHHDYFGNIIPSSWFLLGTFAAGYIFYRKQLSGSLLAFHDLVRPLGEPSTGMDIFLAVGLLLLAFNVMYLIGQLMNGIAAIVLDRVIVKKLLKYPFTLYENKWRNRDDGKPDTLLFREAMLTASYGVFCVNLAPVVFFEIALVAFGRQNPHAGSWVQRHPVYTLALSIVLVSVHFGVPSLRKAREVSGSTTDAKDGRTELMFGHAVLIIVAASIVALAIAAFGFTAIVLLLPGANIAMAIADRKMQLKYGGAYRSEAMRRVFVYARRVFVNPSYFAAKLVGYGSAPDAALIGHALTSAGYDSDANDFYWMCQLRLEHDAPRTYDTAYHGMAMYTMNRNLCNATALIIVQSLVAYYIHWPDGYRHMPLVWVAILCVITYAFFVRYLYLFSGLYSKYVVRAAAFLADRDGKVIVEPGRDA